LFRQLEKAVEGYEMLLQKYRKEQDVLTQKKNSLDAELQKTKKMFPIF
jgi:hypothetical protein